MRRCLLILIVALSFNASAQKIEGIYFNLYTDSLKKGFFNYINVDGECADGSWMPLDSTHIRLTANAGYFDGNNLFIDSSYTGETVTVKAVLKQDPAVWKETVIHIRKRGFDEPLKSSDDILNEMRTKKKREKTAP